MLYRAELVKDAEEIDALYNFIKNQDLDYPGYKEWTRKCYRELVLGYKKAFALTIRDDETGEPIIIGSMVFQQHKQDPSMLELKNGRVNPLFRRKKLFTRLLEAVEGYAKENSYKKILCDAHSDLYEVIIALKKAGYTIESKENLYSKDSLEVILAKDLTVTKKSGIMVSGETDLRELLKGLSKKLRSIMEKLKYHLHSYLHSIVDLVGRKVNGPSRNP